MSNFETGIRVKKLLFIDIGLCNTCRGCEEIAPDIFRYNKDLGFMEVADQDEYDEQLVEEAMKNCPANCIKWDEDFEVTTVCFNKNLGAKKTGPVGHK